MVVCSGATYSNIIINLSYLAVGQIRSQGVLGFWGFGVFPFGGAPPEKGRAPGGAPSGGAPLTGNPA